ncbi:MAG: Gfo/Idh/MocA family oxidoreductase, partial [Bryobacteraceae bacterium]
YSGRLTRAKERWGNDLFTTRDYREIIARKDIDAVIVATPDHWHSRITSEALLSGKDVYCEKPMVQKVEQGLTVIEAQKKSGRILQIGSQYVSSIVFQKANDLLKSGAIGTLNVVEAWLDRDTAIGAWQYSIPPDASPDTVDWDRFLGSAPKRPFEAIRLFRWRNYGDYGTGVAGDLFVHLLSGLHVVTGSIGPKKVYATGGLRFWNDGRDAPDVMMALMDYPKTEAHPAFTVSLRVNLASGGTEEDFGFRFVGNEGVMNTTMAGIKLTKMPREAEPGYTIDTFPKGVQHEFLKQYHEKYPQQRPTADALRATSEQHFTPRQNAHQEHHNVFYRALRSRRQSTEDGVFGFRAAGPALLTNTSMNENRICTWDPQTMTAG